MGTTLRKRHFALLRRRRRDRAPWALPERVPRGKSTQP